MTPRIIITRARVRHVPDAIVISHRPFVITRNGSELSFQNRYGAPVSFRLLASVIVAMPRVLTWAELQDIAYAENPNGGPLSVRDNLCVIRNKHCQRLRTLGLRIVIRKAFGAHAEELGQQLREAA